MSIKPSCPHQGGHQPPPGVGSREAGDGGGVTGAVYYVCIPYIIGWLQHVELKQWIYTVRGGGISPGTALYSGYWRG